VSKSSDEQNSSNISTKKSKTSKSSSSSSSSSTTPTLNSVDLLTFKRLQVGSLLLTCIKEIHALDMVLGLPNQLTGSVSITEISQVVSQAIEKAAAEDEGAEEAEDGNVEEIEQEDTKEHDDEKEKDDVKMEDNSTEAMDTDKEEDEEEIDEENKDNDQNQKEEETSVPNLTDLFSVNQFLACRIISLKDSSDSESKRRIDLSIRPEIVNSGMESTDVHMGMQLNVEIISKEDHGWVVGCGIEGIRGFIHKKHSGK